MRDEMIVGMTRVRNESLIIQDTVEHFLAYVDHIILLDDCSDDRTPELAAATGGDRISIIRGTEWSVDRVTEETRHRALLLHLAQKMGAAWALYFDADERLVGELPPLTANGYRFRLFDGYLTPGMQQSYAGGPLTDLPRMYGPEYRDILMLFRTDCAVFVGKDQRAPRVSGSVALADVFVKHFGKCLSVEQWEENCDYYATYFPQRYRRKWEARRGKAIHTASDFGRELFTWDQLMVNENQWVKL